MKSFVWKISGIVFISIIFIFLMSFYYKTLRVQSVPANGSKQIEKSQYDGVDLISDIEDKKEFHSAIHYPRFQSSKLNASIQSYVKEEKRRFHEQIQSQKWRLFKDPSNFSLTFRLYPVTDSVYSFVFTSESHSDGEKESKDFKIFIVDLAAERFINSQDILEIDEKTKEKLHVQLTDQFLQSKKYKKSFSKKKLTKWLNHPYNDFSNIYLTNKFIVFKFHSNEVTEGAESPEISIPLTKGKELLTEEWRKRLRMEENKPKKAEPLPKKPPIQKDEPIKSKKIVALTFDDGPHPKYTTEILDLLKSYHAKATFFVIGQRVNFYPNIVKRIGSEGHEICNHSFSHKDFTTLKKEKILEEINMTDQEIFKASGLKANCVRPPYGAVNQKVRSAIEKPIILWTVDTLDWKTDDPKKVLKIVQAKTKNGSIILMHDIHSSTVEALKLILPYLKQQGYEFVTVSEISKK
ncbi:polysaccharide deacetylase family protein [Aeribacillus pallidus]|nr:polysaccharide deacetylase family protein [Aeribacillus pallidus]